MAIKQLCPISLFLLQLAACIPINNSPASIQAEQDRGTCLQVAQSANEKWGQQSLKQIYDETPNKTGDQKNYLHLLHQVLGICEADLSKPELFSSEDYGPRIASMRELRSRIAGCYIGDEKKLFLERTGGRTLCDDGTFGSTLLVTIPYSTNSRPRKECLYKVGPSIPPVRVLQALPDGALAMIPVPYGNDIVIHISGNSEADGLVDGATLPYKYVGYTGGTYHYVNLLGPKTVYEFKRIDNPFKNILFYNGS
jgi:hypothetical protein